VDDERRDAPATGGGRTDDLEEALGDADDEALDETDVDPTGNVVRNDAVEKVEDAAVDQRDTDPPG
jgi:hypothetical protein